MKTLNPEFLKHFNELVDFYDSYRSKQNNYTEKGQDLKDRLQEDINEFEPTRYDLMDSLGDITSKFDTEEKKAHKEHVFNTDFHANTQEAPFYWRIINKPAGYA